MRSDVAAGVSWRCRRWTVRFLVPAAIVTVPAASFDLPGGGPGDVVDEGRDVEDDRAGRRAGRPRLTVWPVEEMCRPSRWPSVTGKFDMSIDLPGASQLLGHSPSDDECPVRHLGGQGVEQTLRGEGDTP